MRSDLSRSRPRLLARLAARASRPAGRRPRLLAPAARLRALLNALLGAPLDALARASAPPNPRLIPIERRAARDRTRRERFD
ncbi:Uncharacterised protein [Burkholderia pseudomallei]|nr:Uncharacterised protein [Burkholderia pseudomallei]CAJ7195348.1 Uncharacterised protein [Burkholderia pseudomallei]